MRSNRQRCYRITNLISTVHQEVMIIGIKFSEIPKTFFEAYPASSNSIIKRGLLLIHYTDCSVQWLQSMEI